MAEHKTEDKPSISRQLSAPDPRSQGKNEVSLSAASTDKEKHVAFVDLGEASTPNKRGTTTRLERSGSVQDGTYGSLKRKVMRKRGLRGVRIGANLGDLDEVFLKHISKAESRMRSKTTIRSRKSLLPIDKSDKKTYKTARSVSRTLHLPPNPVTLNRSVSHEIKRKRHSGKLSPRQSKKLSPRQSGGGRTSPRHSNKNFKIETKLMKSTSNPAMVTSSFVDDPPATPKIEMVQSRSSPVIERPKEELLPKEQLQSDDEPTENKFRKQFKPKHKANKSTSSRSLWKSDGDENKDRVTAALEILQKPYDQRNDEDLVEVYQFLDSIDFFQTSLQDQMELGSSASRLEFCRHAMYMKIPAKTVLFKQGDVEKKFYVVVSGSLAVRVKDQFTNTTKRVRELSAGEHFGEIAVKDPEGKRTATVKTLEDSELLVLDEDGFVEVYEAVDEDMSQISDDDEDPTSLLPIVKHCRYRRDGQPRTLDERIDLAIQYIHAAQQSRSIKRHRFKPLFVLQIDSIINSTFYNYLFLVVVMCHLALAIFEPPSTKAARSGRLEDEAWICLYAEWFIFAFYSMAFFAAFYDFGKRFFSKTLNRAWTFVMVLFLLDLLIASGSGSYFLRFSRPFRPVMLVLRLRDLRIMYKISIQTLGHLLHVFIILGLLFLMFAVVGIYLFRIQKDIYNVEKYLAGDGYPDCGGTCPDVLPDYIWNSFQSFDYALITLFVLLTSENFPDVAHPPYMVSHIYNIYFVGFWLIGEAFMLQILIALIFDVYRQLMEDHQLKKMWNERFALHCAFECLDMNQTGHLTHKIFSRVLKKFKWRYNDVQCEALFRMMDVDNNGLLEESEFYDFCDFVRYDIGIEENSDFEETSQPSGLTTLTPAEENKARVPLVSEHTSRKIVAFLNGQTHFVAINVLIALDFVVLFIYGVSPRTNSVTVPLQYFTWSLHTLDAIVLIICLGPRHILSRPWNQFDIIIDAVTLVGLVALSFNSDWGFLRFFGMLRVLRLARLFEKYLQNRKRRQIETERETEIRERVSREGKTVPEVEAEVKKEMELLGNEDMVKGRLTILDAVLRMIPWFLFMCGMLLCVLMYTYAIVGIELFPSADARCSGSEWIKNVPEARFCDFLASLATLLQIVITNNWHDIMYPAIDLKGTVVALYFISFYFFAVLIMYNIMTAVFIEIFQTIKEDDLFSEENDGISLNDLLADAPTTKDDSKELPVNADEDGTNEGKNVNTDPHKRNISGTRITVRKAGEDILDTGLRRVFGRQDKKIFTPEAMKNEGAVGKKGWWRTGSMRGASRGSMSPKTSQRTRGSSARVISDRMDKSPGSSSSSPPRARSSSAIHRQPSARAVSPPRETPTNK